MDKKYEENKELLKLWDKLKIFKFDKSAAKKFIIDTPPPYPSGDLHLGNVLNWCWIDLFAKYKKMRGYSVLFPQGWDVHGLPTEVKVEKAYKIKAEEVEREKWKEMCKEWTEENIKKMKNGLLKLGLSIDWDYEYRTSDDDYKKLVQLSFLDLYRKGLAYRGKYPINFCPSCRTAIADAEVEYEEVKTKLNYILFKVEGEDREVEIATTRPELLGSCVAIGVNPEDEKNKELIGKKLVTPIFGKSVEVLGLREVDPTFGSGIVMICSFGDKQDVDWVLNNNLEVIESIDEKGKIILEPYKGLSVEEARKKIIEDLKKLGKLVKQEEITQKRGTCWRCHKPIEILRREQWFVAVTKFKDRVIEETKKVRWVPDYMKYRQIDWAKGMSRDWCVSRKKIFGTPIPAWQCNKCKKIVLAKEEDLPVDPAKPNSKYEKCEECGGELVGEKETFDTWMDSSFSIAFVSNYLSPVYNEKEKKFDRLHQADLQPNGFDIIRTWDYYLMVRHLMAFNKAPYKNCLINGMVLGKDGRKMSKSLGNTVTFDETLAKYNIDVIRYWTYLATPGSNIIPSDQNFRRGSYLLIKLWNSARFCSNFIKDLKKDLDEKDLKITDRWILTKLSKTIKKVRDYLDNYEAAKALAELEQFFVHDFCDNYLEFVKYRLYKGMNEKEAKFTLHKVLLDIIRMFAPFLPFISEAIYQKLFKEKESIFLEDYPKEEYFDEVGLYAGELLKKIISEVRKWKISNHLSLGKEISKVEVSQGSYSPEELKLIEQDIKEISRAKEVEFKEGEFCVTCYL